MHSARKPGAQEKTALNYAFLATPVVSLALPAITKDVALIWWGNAAVTALCYAYGFSRPAEEEQPEAEEGTEGEEEGGSQQQGGFNKVLIQAFKALDYGSGRERGLRK